LEWDVLDDGMLRLFGLSPGSFVVEAGPSTEGPWNVVGTVEGACQEFEFVYPLPGLADTRFYRGRLTED
jgi:hypothetical protein